MGNLLNLGIGANGMGSNMGSLQMDSFLRRYSAPEITWALPYNSLNSPTLEKVPSSNKKPSVDREVKEGEQQLFKLKEEIATLQRKTQELESRMSFSGLNDDISQDRASKRKR